jgi:hypothetical protein
VGGWIGDANSPEDAPTPNQAEKEHQSPNSPEPDDQWNVSRAQQLDIDLLFESSNFLYSSEPNHVAT